ncbi:DUF6253 family protein [Streptomyces sp. NPDC051636]|uniref:DUF6253 family protein n=1 Tax=Streptomyces sp. NPDC051636 TaxID=3365663 RepID=UPI0037B0F573
MSDLIPATGYIAVFTGIAPDGQTIYHHRPLIAWTVGEDGHLVGQYVNGQGRTAVASNVPNFHRYMTEDEWAVFSLSQYRLPRPIGTDTP